MRQLYSRDKLQNDHCIFKCTVQLSGLSLSTHTSCQLEGLSHVGVWEPLHLDCLELLFSLVLAAGLTQPHIGNCQMIFKMFGDMLRN